MVVQLTFVEINLSLRFLSRQGLAFQNRMRLTSIYFVKNLENQELQTTNSLILKV